MFLGAISFLSETARGYNDWVGNTLERALGSSKRKKELG